MSNPLRLFRKYQYVFLVAFGIMLMFAFVIGPIVSDYLDTRVASGTAANPVVVKWKGQELREIDMANAHTSHLLLTRFLRELTSRARVMADDVVVERAGQEIQLMQGRTYPLVSGGYDSDNQLVYQIVVDGEVVSVPQIKKGSTEPQLEPIRPKAQLIAQAVGEEELVQRMILAEEAEKQGVVVGEDAVIDYLDNICDVTPATRPNYAAMLRDSTDGRLDMRRFVYQMSKELAAQRMLIMSQGGLYAVPPEVLFQCYNKLNRSVSAELLAVDVRDFLDEVGEPTEQQVQALYAEGKDRFPIPTSPDPGFQQRKKIAFQYVVGRYDDFEQRQIDEISPQITDEAIEKYYEDNKETQYKIIELPTAEPADTQTEPTPDGDAPEPPAGSPVDSPASDPPESPAAADPNSPTPSEPAIEPAGTEPSPDPAAGDTPAGSQPEPTEDPEDDELSDDRPASRMPFALASFPVPVDQEQPAADEPATEEPATEEPATEEPTTEEPTTEEPTTEEPTTEEPTGEAAQPPASTDATADSAAEPAPAKYKPLDDALRAEIRQTLARQQAREPAQQKLEESIEAVRSMVNRYSRQLALAQAVEGEAEPAALDVPALAAEYQLETATTPLWDVLDIMLIRQSDPSDEDPAEYEIARATETLWSQAGQARRSLADVAYDGDLEKFVPRQFVDGIVMPGAFPIPPQKLFLYWRVEEQPEETPELEDVRAQVIEAWKLKEALPLAQAKAADLAAQVRTAGKSIVETFPDDKARVIQTMQFSWMTRGSMPGGTGGRPMLSPVNGIADGQPVSVSGAGNEFMRNVFALDEGEVGTATNEPQTYVYVVRLAGESSSRAERQARFFQLGVDADINSLVQEEQAEIIRGWFDQLEDDYAVAWQRPPENDWMNGSQ